ncbi:MAG: MFS transporter [Sphingobacteriales bacterium SCN 48-20]|uniref:MFS transporter n=1 Tax=Terrimonas ferruginea TaxID=249 RepID=UPI00086D30FC|nr:MFS transporter [Terrimonas ferruginea]MBN8783215.1 MFS transporter [Terrimonas ferruginea]ODT95791.1 MAG: MFS transporter [Sphingobacteriales bacterium SCN 48-20]OJW39835.1 MAG: MFS transporter [Sphingobacteriales bacterium 48-107]
MKVKGLRWWIITLIAVATIINYIDRSAINIMWPYIYKEFGIADENSKAALGLISNFFLVAYAIGQTLTGKMMDAIGTRMGMVVSIVGWSISIALHAVARSLASFSVFRMLLGVSEAGNWPGATKSNAEWFPVRERAIAQGIFGAGASMGSVVAAPVIAGLYLSYGWRATFAGIAVLGILWVIPWLLINKSTPDKHPWITKEEQDHILDKDTAGTNGTAGVKVLSWKELLRFRNTWGIITSRFFIDPIWWVFVIWLPTFLKDQFEFDIKQVGAFAWVPYLFAAVGGLLGGFYSSALVRRGVAPAKARKSAITIGAAIMLAALAATAFSLDQLSSHVNLAIALISATLFGFQFLINNLQTLPADYYHGKNVGTVSGLGGTAAVLGTIIINFLVPVITKTSYITLFVTAALMVPLAWFCITFITTKTKRT